MGKLVRNIYKPGHYQNLLAFQTENLSPLPDKIYTYPFKPMQNLSPLPGRTVFSLSIQGVTLPTAMWNLYLALQPGRGTHQTSPEVFKSLFGANLPGFPDQQAPRPPRIEACVRRLQNQRARDDDSLQRTWVLI